MKRLAVITISLIISSLQMFSSGEDITIHISKHSDRDFKLFEGTKYYGLIQPRDLPPIEDLSFLNIIDKKSRSIFEIQSGKEIEVETSLQKGVLYIMSVTGPDTRYEVLQKLDLDLESAPLERTVYENEINFNFQINNPTEGTILEKESLQAKAYGGYVKFVSKDDQLFGSSLN